MLKFLEELIQETKRYLQLKDFWKLRTVFYRDLAKSLEKNELFRDFIKGELDIAINPVTEDKSRAKGFIFLNGLTESSDLSLYETLVATMPKSDKLALSTIQFANNKPLALRQLAENIEEQNQMTQMIRSALVSPMLLLPVAFAFAYILSTVSIPEFAKAAPEEVWTPFNLLVKNSAEIFSNYGLGILLVIVLSLVWIFTWALENLTPNWRYQMEKARGYASIKWIVLFPFQPIFAIYRDIQGTRMLGNLANLMLSGMILTDAIKSLTVSAQPWMRKHLIVIDQHLQTREGDHIGAFSHGVLPVFLLSRMSSLIRSDKGQEFNKVLIELGTQGMIEARESVKKSAVKINSILLVAAFSVITFFYVGQNMIAISIQDANSPSAVIRRQVQAQQQPVVAPQSQPSVR